MNIGSSDIHTQNQQKACGPLMATPKHTTNYRSSKWKKSRKQQGCYSEELTSRKMQADESFLLSFPRCSFLSHASFHLSPSSLLRFLPLAPSGFLLLKPPPTAPSLSLSTCPTLEYPPSLTAYICLYNKTAAAEIPYSHVSLSNIIQSLYLIIN